MHTELSGSKTTTKSVLIEPKVSAPVVLYHSPCLDMIQNLSPSQLILLQVKVKAEVGLMHAMKMYAASRPSRLFLRYEPPVPIV